MFSFLGISQAPVFFRCTLQSQFHIQKCINQIHSKFSMIYFLTDSSLFLKFPKTNSLQYLLQSRNVIYSAAFTTNGRKFEKISNKINNTILLESPMFPNEQYKFNKRHFRLGVNYVSLFTVFCVSWATCFGSLEYVSFRHKIVHVYWSKLRDFTVVKFHTVVNITLERNYKSMKEVDTVT